MPLFCPRKTHIPRHSIEPLESRIVLATFIWDGSAGDSDWLNPQNWNQNAVPGTGDTAILDTNSTIDLATSVDVGSFQQRAGTITGLGVLRILNTFLWAGGTMSGSGTTQADGGVLINGNVVFLDGRTLNLAAGQTATLSGGNALGMQNGARINNSGAFLVQSDAANDFFNNGGAASLFNNTGTFIVDTPAAGQFDVLFPFANSGTIDVRTGTIIFSGGFAQAASGAILGGNSVIFAAGVVTAGGTIVADVSNNGASLSPGAGAGATGELSITGNYVQGFGGTLRTELGGVGPGQFDKLTVSGTATLSGTLIVSLLGGFSPPDAQEFNVLTYGSHTGSFGSTSAAPGFTLNYQPTALVLTSNLIRTNYVWDGGGGLDTSWFNASNWGPDGVPGASDTATLSSNATITLPSPTNVASFTQSAGTLSGAGRLNVHNFTWSGGTQAGSGITAISLAGSFSIEGDGTKIITERRLNLAGRGTWTGAGNVEMSDGAVLNNSGGFDIQNDARLEYTGSGAEPLFVNSGMVRKTTATGNTVLAGVDFVNLGQLRLSSGTLAFEGASASFTQTRGLTLLSGGSLSAPNSNVTFDGGTLVGSGTLSASVINSGAIVQPGARGNAGTLAITGDYTQSGQARLVIELGGKAPGSQYDQFLVGGVATLGGILSVNSIRGFAIRAGGSFTAITYGSFNSGLPMIDAPAGVTANAAANELSLNARRPPPGARVMTMTESDGDIVTAKVTKGSIPLNAITMGLNGEFQKLDLRAVDSKLKGAKLTIDVQQSGNGDGVVNVGAIDATGMDLSKIILAGDLGQIDIGTGSARKPALKSLVVGSLGAMGASTQPGGTDDPLLSEVTGSLDKLTVTRDVQNAVVEVSGKLGKVVIGGSLVDDRPSAALRSTPGSIGVFLNGGIPPADASEAGSIFAPSIGTVTVMGDIDGGEISVETQIKRVKIVGKLTSDDPLDPAILRVGTGVDKVVVTGDVKNALILAGYNRTLEPVNPDATIGKVVAKGNWTASSVVAGVADPDDDGFGITDMLITGDTTPNRLAKIASVIIKGTATGSPTLTDHSAITAQKISALRISDVNFPLTRELDALSLDPLNQNFSAVEI